MWTLLVGCLLVTEDEHAAREAEIADRDGDGLWALAFGGTDCDDSDPEVGEAEPYFVDGDGDGFGDEAGPAVCDLPENGTREDGDCDDDDAAIHPDAAELCDGLDNDCDGLRDEDDADDAATWYADSDGDGFGDPSSTTLACTEPIGFVVDASDCDDTSAEVNTDARETCDGEDTDCNGTVDDPHWWPDTDGDGFGDPDGKTLVSCDQPAGHADDALDCDDTDFAVHPNASEWCGDGVDNDCDGETDEDESVDATTWYEDADGDGWGNAAATTRACEQPEGFLADHGDCDDTDPTVSPSATETWYDGVDEDCDNADDFDADGDGFLPTKDYDGEDCDDHDALIHPDALEACGDGIDNNCDASDDLGECALSGDIEIGDQAKARFLGNAYYDRVGIVVAGPGDVDNDGYADVLVAGASAAWLHTGPVTGDIDVTSGVAFCDYCTGSQIGTMTSPGDLNSDGFPDLLLSYAGNYTSLLLGPLTTGSAAFEDDAHALFQAYYAPDSADGAGDFDGDGQPDLVFGDAYDYANQGYEAYLHLGPASGVLELDEGDADLVISATYEGAALGAGVAGVGDTDGDGLDDLAIGGNQAYNEDLEATGYVLLVLGNASPGEALDDVDADAILWGRGTDDSGYIGASLDGAGDTDGDGYDDLLIGSSGRGAWVVRGPLSGTATIGDRADATLAPPDAYAYRGGQIGDVVSSAGDVDGDGRQDVLMSNYSTGREEGEVGTGLTFLFLGTVTGYYLAQDADAVLEGELYSYSGYSLDETGDVTGDGYGDFLIGAYSYDDPDEQSGAAYLMAGGVD